MHSMFNSVAMLLCQSGRQEMSHLVAQFCSHWAGGGFTSKGVMRAREALFWLGQPGSPYMIKITESEQTHLTDYL